MLSLPLLFAAGMTLMDTVDGLFLAHAYGWAFSNPVKKIYYNIAITSLSVVIALVIGTVELLHVMSTSLGLRGRGWDSLNNLDFGTLGYAMVVLFIIVWAVSVSVWKVRQADRRPMERDADQRAHSVGSRCGRFAV